MASTSRNEILEQEVPFQSERRIADEIMETVIRLELPFKLDQLTKGDGNCFPRAIIQQCKRPEIFSQLRTLVKRLVKDKSGYSMLRSSVQKFILKSKLQKVGRLKTQYYEYDSNIRGEHWEEYWHKMTEDKEWVDFSFVQATAWDLQLDLYIVPAETINHSFHLEENLMMQTYPIMVQQ